MGRADLPSLAGRKQWLKDDEKAMVQERGIDPSSRAVHVLAGKQWDHFKRILRLAGGTGVVARGSEPEHSLGGSVQGSVADGAEPGKNSAAEGEAPTSRAGGKDKVISSLDMRQLIFEDSQDSRPSFLGGPDDFRRRCYMIDDADSGKFSVSIAEKKANGEGPSDTISAAATGLVKGSTTAAT